MNQFDFPPMSPDDLNALASIAGPLFGESRNIERMTGDNTVVGGHLEDGSMKIKTALQQAENLVRSQRPPPPQYVPPEFIQEIQYIPTPTYTPHIPNPPMPMGMPLFPHPDSGQLEFSFEKKGMDETNDLLREISKKLSTLIKVVNGMVKEDAVPKLKLQPEQNKTQNVKQT